MVGVPAKKILDRVPGALTIRVPDEWYANVPTEVSVFESLYRWLVAVHAVDAEGLHNRTYAPKSIMRRLLERERVRLAKVHRIRGEELELAVSFSNMDSGPQERFAGMDILGDVLIIVRGGDKDADAAQLDLRAQQRDKTTKKIADLASGPTFKQWLISSVGRDDPIGDLAEDTKRDSAFPTEDRYQLIFFHLERYGSAVLSALNDAWVEYAAKYPARIVPEAWCELCREPVTVLPDGEIEWADDETAFRVQHKACRLEEVSDFRLPLSAIATGLPTAVFEDFLAPLGVGNDPLVDLEDRLALWGFRSVASADGNVYFVQSGQDGPIKIGFSSRPLGQRLSALQTANAEPLRVLAELKGSRKTERDLHAKFQTLRKMGEWFEPHPDLLAFIGAIKSARGS